MVGPNDMPPAPTIVIFGPSCLSEEIAESLTRGRLITPEQGWALHEKVGGAGKLGDQIGLRLMIPLGLGLRILGGMTSCCGVAHLRSFSPPFKRPSVGGRLRPLGSAAECRGDGPRCSGLSASIHLGLDRK